MQYSLPQSLNHRKFSISLSCCRLVDFARQRSAWHPQIFNLLKITSVSINYMYEKKKNMNNNKKWATFHIWMLFVCLINYLCRTRVVYDIQAKYTFDIKTKQRSIRPISEKKKKYFCFDRKQLFFSICISSFNERKQCEYHFQMVTCKFQSTNELKKNKWSQPFDCFYFFGCTHWFYWI